MRRRLASLALLIAGGLILVWLGSGIAQSKPLGGLDFRALYVSAGATVLLAMGSVCGYFCKRSPARVKT